MSVIFLVIKMLLEYLPDVFLSLLPFDGRFRHSLPTMLLTGGACLLCFICVTLYAGSTLPPARLYAYCAVLSLPLQLFLARAFLRASVFQLLFALFLVRNFMDAVLFFHLVLEYYWNGSPHSWYHPENCLLPLSAVLIISVPFIRLFLTRVLQPAFSMYGATPLWRFLWIIPCCFYIIHRTSPHTCVTVLSQEAVFSRIAWIFSSFFFHYAALQILLETTKYMHSREHSRMTAVHLSMRERHCEALFNSIEKMHEARGELKRHLLMIKKLAHCRDAAGIQRYLSQSLAVLSSEKGVALCENHAADAVIRHYADLARDHAVQVTMSLEIPERLPIAVNDLCIILGNLLENAVEACMRQSAGERFIQLKAKTGNKNMVVISVKNSFDHKIRQSGTLFLSSKRRGEGIGTASIHSIADKYLGIAKFIYSEHVFQAFVLLNGASTPGVLKRRCAH